MQNTVSRLLVEYAAVSIYFRRWGSHFLIHGESTRPDVDIFDRERVFIEDTVMELRCNYPQLKKIVLEHITTQDAVRYIQEQEDGLTAATITPQHLLFNRNVCCLTGDSAPLLLSAGLEKRVSPSVVVEGRNLW